MIFSASTFAHVGPDALLRSQMLFVKNFETAYLVKKIQMWLF